MCMGTRCEEEVTCTVNCVLLKAWAQKTSFPLPPSASLLCMREPRMLASGWLVGGLVTVWVSLLWSLGGGPVPTAEVTAWSPPKMLVQWEWGRGEAAGEMGRVKMTPERWGSGGRGRGGWGPGGLWVGLVGLVWNVQGPQAGRGEIQDSPFRFSCGEEQTRNLLALQT